MRNNIVHVGADELTYEIREIVDIAKKIEKFGVEITWENIGDPVAKGEKIPLWIKEIVAELAMDDSSYAYCPTKGLLETREFLAELTNKRGGAQITAEDIIFFNGLGDAIAKIYGLLRKEARVIGPSPAYSTHSSAEGAHAGCPPITYYLDPENNWYPDLDDLRNKVKYNPSIAGILIINPDNPTGAVYPKKVLDEIVDIANEYDLFIISDEIYCNLVYNGKKTALLPEVIDDVCGISLKGISKEIPWPGARCGWMEVYNVDKDPIFKKYIESICRAKMVEVCSTTLPQKAIPRILSHKEYKKYLKERNAFYEKASNIAYNKLKDIEGIIVNRTNGAFYMSVVFREEYLNENQKLHVENEKLRAFVENLVKNVPYDKRFVYYLLASTGICVVPLTSFCSDLKGFRITLLEKNENKFNWIYETVSEKIKEYLNV
ncbi:pyridoxal phosphate-dependent aminotransferase [Methanotorris igneus]|uniref:Aspartate transaminase n=1 Tax=Methanotorris igneus (strain DSM 5666 / JCM 11834 / Kol 5) TaxID=880724 RepID=F6BCA6_METIK|nr:pyridoxal phosphate-dependent aminotransferase [Methanotorris igneus]AEF97312.1 Aspartate transaminase [Methanotorris igneus Kol 5]